ncbi:MAG: hypothetical protein E6G34_06415 [Actinobacteria bacterium]|nr:MAG: hypothetical protein E6G34_06415 [Actinomycetota bacterium]
MAVEQSALFEQAAVHERGQARVGPAAAHREALHQVLGAGRTEAPDPIDDFRIPFGLHTASSARSGMTAA